MTIHLSAKTAQRIYEHGVILQSCTFVSNDGAQCEAFYVRHTNGVEFALLRKNGQWVTY